MWVTNDTLMASWYGGRMYWKQTCVSAWSDFT